MATKPPTPAEQLAEWTKALEQDQSQGSDLAKEIDRLKSQITDLTKTVGDADQKGKAWDKAAQAATQQQSDLATYVKTKTTMLEATVANKDAVVKTKAAALKDLADKVAAVQTAQTAATTKQQAWETAKAGAASKQAAYDNYAGLSAANDSILKDLTALRTQADKEGAANNVSRMYFLVLAMADVLQNLNIPSTATYTTELNSRTSDLATAGQAEKLAKIAADKAGAEAQQAQKNLDDARTKWRQTVLDSIPNGGAAAASAPVVAASPVSTLTPAAASPPTSALHTPEAGT